MTLQFAVDLIAVLFVTGLLGMNMLVAVKVGSDADLIGISSVVLALLTVIVVLARVVCWFGFTTACWPFLP